MSAVMGLSSGEASHSLYNRALSCHWTGPLIAQASPVQASSRRVRENVAILAITIRRITSGGSKVDQGSFVCDLVPTIPLDCSLRSLVTVPSDLLRASSHAGLYQCTSAELSSPWRISAVSSGCMHSPHIAHTAETAMQKPSVLGPRLSA